MAQLVKFYFLSTRSRLHLKAMGMMVHTCDHSHGKMGDRDGQNPKSTWASQPSLLSQVPGQWGTLSQGGKYLGILPWLSLNSIHVLCLCMSAHTYALIQPITPPQVCAFYIQVQCLQTSRTVTFWRTLLSLLLISQQECWGCRHQLPGPLSHAFQGSKLRSSGLQGKCFYLLSHFLGPTFTGISRTTSRMWGFRQK